MERMSTNVSQPRLSLDEAVGKTKYFRDSLENLLCRLQPTFHCLKLTVTLLIHGPDGSGKRMLAKMAAKNLGMNFCEERVADMFDENIVGTEKKVKATFGKFLSYAPCLIYLTGYELFCSLDELDLDRVEHTIKESLEELSEQSKQPIVFIASTNDFQKVYKTQLSELFQYDIALISPTQEEALEILQSIKERTSVQSDARIVLKSLTHGAYFIGNLLDALARSEVSQHRLAPGVDHKSEEIESSNEGTRWTDIGGLGDIKREIIDAIQLSIDYPQLKKSGLRRTGLLLYGPPGTGKTLLARAVANECNLNFINVKGPELLNEYVGQSEDNIRKLFQRARDASPSVIFFDEIDSLAPNRGQAGDSGGVMDRMVSQILAELDGVGKCDGVFVIGATNRVDLVDPSLLRPGRFDKVLEVPLPVTKSSRLQILKALTRKMTLADDVDLDLIESSARPLMSGADFQGLCSRTMQRSFDRCIELLETKEKTEDDVEIVCTMEDFLESIRETQR